MAFFRININDVGNNSKNFLSTHLRNSLHSLRHKKMLFLTLLPCVSAVVIWFVFFIISINNFGWYIAQFPSMWVDYAFGGSGFFSLVSYFLLYFFATASMILYGVLICGVFMIIISGFLSPFVVAFVRDNYYSHLKLNPPNFIESIKLTSLVFAKTLLKFLVLSALCYCLNFIGLGFIGLILNIFIYFRFFATNLNYEIALNIMDKDICNTCINHNKIHLFFLNIIIFIPLYIPVINLFVNVWQMLVLSHFMLDWYSRITRSSEEIIIDAEVIER